MKQNLINVRHLAALLFVALISCSGFTRASDSRPLLMGVAPFNSTVSLFERFSPLSRYLSENLGREVVINTASNPEQFFQKIKRHEYDLVFATPQLAIKALKDNYYDIGVISAQDSQPLLMVEAQGIIFNTEQLAKKRVALPPESSVISLMAEKWFISKGVKAEELPQFVYFNSHNAAYQAALEGDVDAAFVASFAVKQLRKQLPILRIIDSADYLPGSSILYARPLDKELKERLTLLMVRLKNSQQGREVLNKMSHPPFRKGDNAEYESISPYLPMM